jgi:RNA polymerase sigma-70 factor (ECF subfamily)
MVSKSRFEELAIPHRNSAFNLAYWILQSREDAEDAVQDAYVRAFRAFDTFAGGEAPPGFWPSCATSPIAPWMLVSGRGT